MTIKILDSTLREGEQSPGVYFSPEQKLAIARLLDQVGIDIIEAGNPAVDEEIAAAVRLVASAGLRARIGAHARCKIEDVRLALECGAQFLGVFLSVSSERLGTDYRFDLDEAIVRLSEVIVFAKQCDLPPVVRFTAEDAPRSPIENVVRAALAAVRAGADIVSVADTTGYASPFSESRRLARLITQLKEALSKEDLHAEIEVHCHNDRGLALANALDACRAGADIVDTSVLGLGERAGIVDLAELLVNLKETFGQGNHWRLDLLPELYALVAEYSGITVAPNRPVAGESIFTHNAGVHVKAMMKNPSLYESLDPRLLGRQSKINLGLQSGSASIQFALRQIGRNDLVDHSVLVGKILEEVKTTARQRVAVDLATDFPAIVERCERLEKPARQVEPRNAFQSFELEAVEQSIPARFEQQAAENGGRLAVKTRNGSWSYSELNRWANRIAHSVLERRGPKPEAVALMLGHDESMVAAILGIQKAGKFYVCLDTSLPDARLQYLLEDSQACTLITSKKNLDHALQLAGDRCTVLTIEEAGSNPAEANLGLAIAPEQLAYIMYTSGSTGQPNGVMQSHRNTLHNVMKYSNSIHITVDDRFALFASFSFIASMSGLFGALLNGASLFPYRLREEGLDNIGEWLRENQITVYHSVPIVFRHFAARLPEGSTFPQLRLIKLGGDAVYRKDFELYREHFDDSCIFHVGFGATEINVIRQLFLDKSSKFEGNIVPVGYEVDQTEVLILDENGVPAGFNRPGQIVIRSRFLSPGYWGKPELTQAAFRTDSNDRSLQLYHTGDMGCLKSDGCLIHLGRQDFQVKIRGHRVETTEVEATLLSLPSIKEAVVAAREDSLGDKSLVAYVVSRNGNFPGVDQLRNHLKDKLPEYMVPSVFVMLEKLPLLPNNKVDRIALPAPDHLRPQIEQVFVAPRTPTEETLASVWKDLLNIDQVGIHDNFFSLGGNSLQATQITSRVRETLAVELPLRAIFETATIAELAHHVESVKWLSSDTLYHDSVSLEEGTV
jgi:amino acid adenylation domain-containing protein